MTQQPIPNYNTKMRVECDFGKNSDFESYQYYWNGTVCPKQSTLSEHQKLKSKVLLSIIEIAAHAQKGILRI